MDVWYDDGVETTDYDFIDQELHITRRWRSDGFGECLPGRLSRGAHAGG